MVHGTSKLKNSKRTSPNKDKKKAAYFIEKKPKEEPQLSALPAEQLPNNEDELLTPEFILSSYSKTKSTSQNQGVGILELLSKRDNLEKLANSVSNAVQEKQLTLSPPIEVPTKPTTGKSPPSTPKASPSERFAGLSNSPVPQSLPLPSFQPITPQPITRSLPPTLTPKSTTPQPKIESQNNKIRNPSPPTREKFGKPLDNTPNVNIPFQTPPPILSHSPPSNPHLEYLSNQLRMMLHINVQS